MASTTKKTHKAVRNTATKRELVTLAKDDDAYTSQTLGVAPSKATKKQLRRGIMKKIAIAGGSVTGALLLGGLGVRYGKTKKRSTKKRKYVESLYDDYASEDAEATITDNDVYAAQTKAQSIPQHVIDEVTPSEALIINAERTLEADEHQLRRVCARLFAQVDAKTPVPADDKKFLVDSVYKYRLIDEHGNPLSLKRIVQRVVDDGEKMCPSVRIARIGKRGPGDRFLATNARRLIYSKYLP